MPRERVVIAFSCRRRESTVAHGVSRGSAGRNRSKPRKGRKKATAFARSGSSFAPPGLDRTPPQYPRLTPWALALSRLRRFRMARRLETLRRFRMTRGPETLRRFRMARGPETLRRFRMVRGPGTLVVSSEEVRRSRLGKLLRNLSVFLESLCRVNESSSHSSGAPEARKHQSPRRKPWVWPYERPEPRRGDTSHRILPERRSNGVSCQRGNASSLALREANGSATAERSI